MKITIVGIGKVGYTVTEELSSEGHDVTIIDRSTQVIRDTTGNIDVIGVCGSGTNRAVLEEANIKDCDLVIALTGIDETNLLCCLLAKQMGAKETIARIRSKDFYDNPELLENTIGLSMSVNPEMEAASDIQRVLEFPAAKNVDVFAKGMIDLVSFVADDRCNLCGKTIKEYFANVKEQTLICAVRRGTEVYIPGGDFTFEKGDVVAVLVSRDEITDFFEHLGLPSPTVKNVMIIGGGTIATHLAGDLGKRGINVTIVEKDANKAQTISYQLPCINVICGDGTNRALLLEEGISDMDAVICLTGFDEENIVLSLFARSLDPNIKTVTKVNKIVFHELMRTLDVGSVVYPKYITSNRILRYVRAKQRHVMSNLETLTRIIDNTVEALEFKVGENSKLLGKTLREMKLKPNVLIGCINRDGKTFIPHGDDVIKAGDLVVVVTTISGLSDFDEIRA